MDRMVRMRRPFPAATIAALLLAGCHVPVAWRGPVLLGGGKPVPPARATAVTNTTAAAEPGLPPPRSLRPCCAFGTGLKVEVEAVPVPLVQVDNVVEADALGTHNYDNGSSPIGADDREGLFASEKNGLVYTCRGGFIDIAHVRDYADWTIYLASEVDRRFESGGVIVLPPEGGDRYVVLQPVTARLTPAQRRAAVIDVARWAVFQLSVWHELATGSGWASFQMFPETASTFSPEDLFSNALGTRLAGEILAADQANGEGEFNAALTARLPGALHALGALPKAGTHAVLAALDGDWWDSTQRLPSELLVKTRNYAFQTPLRPWLAPPAAVQRWCPPAPPTPQTIATRIGREPIDRIVRVFITPDERIELALPHPPSRWVSQRDFPALAAQVRETLAAKGLRDHP